MEKSRLTWHLVYKNWCPLVVKKIDTRTEYLPSSPYFFFQGVGESRLAAEDCFALNPNSTGSTVSPPSLPLPSFSRWRLTDPSTPVIPFQVNGINFSLKKSLLSINLHTFSLFQAGVAQLLVNGGRPHRRSVFPPLLILQNLDEEKWNKMESEQRTSFDKKKKK